LTIRRWGSTEDVSSTKLRFDPGDIIFGKRRVYQRKLAVADFHGICSAHALVLRAKPEAVLPEFLPYFMQSDYFMEAALKISVGSLSPTINWKTLAQYEFDLPPIDEQRVSVLRLHAADSAVDSLCRLTRSLSTAMDSLVDERLRTRPRGPISDFLEVVTKGTTPTTSGHAFVETGVTFIRAEDVTDRELDLSGCSTHIASETHALLGRSQIFAHDVLLTIAGTVGRVGYVPDGVAEMNCNQAVAILRPKNSDDSKFLFAWLKSHDSRRQMRGGQVTGTISNLSLTTIKALAIPKLTQFERDLLSSDLNSLEVARSEIESRNKSLRMLKSRCLTEMFADRG
jgi:type I restriction enzyme S subunit